MCACVGRQHVVCMCVYILWVYPARPSTSSPHHPLHPPNNPHTQDLPNARARAYDIVYNGVELGGGSLRIYRRDVQQQVFKAIGLSEQEAREKFGYLLDSFQLGAPPHGGIALGVDRLVMLLAGKVVVVCGLEVLCGERSCCVVRRQQGGVVHDFSSSVLYTTPSTQVHHQFGMSLHFPRPHKHSVCLQVHYLSYAVLCWHLYIPKKHPSMHTQVHQQRCRRSSLKSCI